MTEKTGIAQGVGSLALGVFGGAALLVVASTVLASSVPPGPQDPRALLGIPAVGVGLVLALSTWMSRKLMAGRGWLAIIEGGFGIGGAIAALGAGALFYFSSASLVDARRTIEGWVTAPPAPTPAPTAPTPVPKDVALPAAKICPPKMESTPPPANVFCAYDKSSHLLRTEGRVSDTKMFLGEWRDFDEAGRLRRHRDYGSGGSVKSDKWFHENGAPLFRELDGRLECLGADGAVRAQRPLKVEPDEMTKPPVVWVGGFRLFENFSADASSATWRTNGVEVTYRRAADGSATVASSDGALLIDGRGTCKGSFEAALKRDPNVQVIDPAKDGPCLTGIAETIEIFSSTVSTWANVACR